MQPLAAAADVSLIVVGSPETRYVLADRQRLRQVLLNLISNAIKYNRPRGNVLVSWSSSRWKSFDRRGGRRTWHPGQSPRGGYSHPFDRLGAEGTGVEGTGIGLTVSRSLAELMHGTLSFEAGDVRGATFTITLPESDAPIAAAAASLTSDSHLLSANTAPATLLYIEDNEPNVKVMELVLGLRSEWQMSTQLSVNLGLELAHAHRPDLILLDLHLPDQIGARRLDCPAA